MPSGLAAVILDWAGTTVDFGSRAPVEVIRTVFQQAGIEVTEHEARQSMGKAKREHLSDLLSMPRIGHQWSSIHHRPANDEVVGALYNDFIQRQTSIVVSYSALIPGCAEAAAECRRQGLRIGSTTGYNRAVMDAVAARAKSEGYSPDSLVCADDISPGRPAPWICFEAARRLDVYPMSAILTVDDTPAGIASGRNAGTWTAAVVVTGNEVGLTRVVLDELPNSERQARFDRARSRLTSAGAHFLIDSIADLPLVVAQINQRIAKGDCP
jgi:phosphonoacetaldehyde hydrolase